MVLGRLMLESSKWKCMRSTCPPPVAADVACLPANLQRFDGGPSGVFDALCHPREVILRQSAVRQVTDIGRSMVGSDRVAEYT